MKSFFLATALFLLCGLQATMAQKNISPRLKATVNLLSIQNDKVHVTVYAPALGSEETVYIMPASIPGTYARMDFGYYIQDFKAFDKKGRILPVRRESDNEFRIIGARNLGRVEYDVNDSYDDTTHKTDVFNPAGTNMQADSNIMLGHHGFIGYFENMQKIPYEITVLKPRYFWGATSLSKKSVNDTTDLLLAADYDELVDNPSMYSRPDTVTYQQGRTKITVAVYSTGGKVTAQAAAKALRPVTNAAEKFFGTMPVDRYTFILYFVGNERRDLRRREAYGALEHNYSSVYFLPEASDEASLNQWLTQTAVHEFLHILVPLNLHSREIDNFDFRNPVMSRHLWLYEGVTEYFSVLAQSRSGMLSTNTLISRLRRKIIGGEMMMQKPVSLTELSVNVMLPEYQAIYPVIYEKGAITALLLDIRLRELTAGKMDLLGLVRRLSARFGPSRPFEDSTFFDLILKETSADLKPFIDSLIEGTAPLPLAEYFDKIGWEFAPQKKVQGYSFGGMRLEMREDKMVITAVRDTAVNPLSVQPGDKLISVNGHMIDPENADDDENLMALYAPQTDDEITIQVDRNGTLKDLRGRPIRREKDERWYLGVKPDATEAQKAMAKAIFN